MNRLRLQTFLACVLLSAYAVANAEGKPAVGTAATEPTATDEQRSFSDYEEVAAALKPYIDAAKSGDGNLSRSAFYDHAHIVGSIGGNFSNADLNAFTKSINSGGPSPSVGHRIAWIDVSGPAAAAKVEFINWRGRRFTDFFVLYRHAGVWRISGKVYDSHSNN